MLLKSAVCALAVFGASAWLVGCGSSIPVTPSDATTTASTDRRTTKSSIRAPFTAANLPSDLSPAQQAAYLLGSSSTGSCPEAALAPAARLVICEAPPSASSRQLAPYASSATQTTSVDLRNYLAAVISTASGSGSMICDPIEDNAAGGLNPSCLTSFYDGNASGETEIVNGNGLIDYIAITSETQNPFGEGALQYIGVARNYPGGNNPLRCFDTATSPNSNCTAPPSGHVFGAPYLIQKIPVVSWATAQATENDADPTATDAYGTKPIPGALITTPSAGDGVGPPNYENFGVNNMSSTCAQTHSFNTYSQGQIVYVTGVPFGGSIGTQDAIVLDGYSNDSPSVLERYYYVKGYGRVRESVSYKYSGSTTYGVKQPAGGFQALDRNAYRPYNANIIYANGNHGGCPQGSAVPIHT